MAKTTKPVAFVGCGYTPLTRDPVKTESELAVEAILDAARDAGIDPAEIDGMNIQTHHGEPPDANAIGAACGIRDIKWRVDGGIGIIALAKAAEAVASGTCNYAVVVKVMDTHSPINTPDIDPVTVRVPGRPQFEVPYGLGYTMQRIGFLGRRYMHKFGVTEEQIGWLCVTEREHAIMNPNGFFRTPITIDDYLNSRWIAAPLRLLDCDRPVNGAYAYIVTRGDRAAGLRHPPVFLKSYVSYDGDPSQVFHLLPEDFTEAPNDFVKPIFADAGIGPKELDVWNLYDGFSFFPFFWMESLGLVPRGEAGNYVEGGKRIRFDGEHPVNTHGGQLSEGRMHGAGHILEAVQQLRGNAGARQAKRHDTAVVSTAFTTTGGAAIFSR